MLSLNVTDFWMITLHNKNKYLPGFHQVFGSSYTFSIPNLNAKVKRSQQGVFALSKTDMHFLNLGGNKACIDDDQNMEACVDSYIEKKIGCRYGIEGIIEFSHKKQHLFSVPHGFKQTGAIRHARLQSRGNNF